MEIIDATDVIAKNIEASTAKLAEAVQQSLSDDVERFADAEKAGKTEQLNEIVHQEFVPQLVMGLKESQSYALGLLSWLCSQVAPGVIPEVTSETYGSEARISVKVADKYIGSLTVTLSGGEDACLLATPMRLGVALEIDGKWASKYFCSDPAHQAARSGNTENLQ